MLSNFFHGVCKIKSDQHFLCCVVRFATNLAMNLALKTFEEISLGYHYFSGSEVSISLNIRILKILISLFCHVLKILF